MGIYDVYPNDLIEKTAEELKKNEAVKPPVWTAYVKTGVHNERAPLEKDWWYTRAAAVLRSIFILGPIGVQKLRTKYGGKKRRGHQPAIFKKGSGSVIRKVLQQLDKAGFTKFAEKGVHKGRIITKEGKLFLKKVADSIGKVKKEATPVEKPKKKVKVIKKKEVELVKKKEEVKPEVPKEEVKPEPAPQPKAEPKVEKKKEEAPKPEPEKEEVKPKKEVKEEK